MALAEFLKSCNASCVKTIKIHRQAVPVKMKATEGQRYQVAWWLCVYHNMEWQMCEVLGIQLKPRQ